MTEMRAKVFRLNAEGLARLDALRAGNVHSVHPHERLLLEILSRVGPVLMWNAMQMMDALLDGCAGNVDIAIDRLESGEATFEKVGRLN